MYTVRSIEIEGFWHRHNVKVDFNDGVNVVSPAGVALKCLAGSMRAHTSEHAPRARGLPWLLRTNARLNWMSF